MQKDTRVACEGDACVYSLRNKQPSRRAHHHLSHHHGEEGGHVHAVCRKIWSRQQLYPECQK